MFYEVSLLSENLQDKAAQQAVNYFQISELELVFGVIIIAFIWVMSTYYLQNRLQKCLMKDIEAYKENVEKRLRDIDYKNGYYNKILDRRINAYEKLNEIVLEATLISKINSYEFYSLFYSYAKFSEHYSRLKVLSKYFIWYSPNIVELLNKYLMLISYMNAYYLGSKSALIKFLQESNINDSRIITIKTDLDKIYINPPKDRVVIPCDTKITSIGIICHETIQSLHCEIIRDFNDDLSSLYKIEDFLSKE